MRSWTEKDVEIVDAGVKGNMIGKKDGRVFILQNVIPGDVVDVLVKRRKKSFFEGLPVAITQPSPHRTESFCTHFGECGGCKWQNISYEKQLALKQKMVADAFSRVGGIDAPASEPIIPAPETRFYRNKLDFSASANRWFTTEEIENKETLDNYPALGFHVQGRFDKVLDIEYCHLQNGSSNDIRLALKKFAAERNYPFWDPLKHTGFIRSLIIRTTLLNHLMVIVVFSNEDTAKIDDCLNFLKERFPEITSLYYVVNDKRNDALNDLPYHHFSGNKYMEEAAGEIKFLLGPASFYQTNSSHAVNLYSVAREFAGLTGNEHLLDLYCGVGTAGLFMAGKCKSVTGIEVVEEAIYLARQNAEKNGAENTTYICGEAEKVLYDAGLTGDNKPDVVVTDPPRAGMHKKVVKFLLDLEVPRIVYVSCNPSTQARDCALLCEKYEIKKMKPVDMFPHTYHVENVALLELKSK